MNLGRYRLDQQLGAGRDGVAYAAWDEDAQRSCEVRALSAARADLRRWAALTKRLKHAALVKHPHVLAILQTDLDGSPPLAVLETRGLSGPIGPLPWAEAQVRDLAIVLSGALAEAHRVGLTHGSLAPRIVPGPELDQLALDFTGLECSDLAVDPRFQAPEVAAGKPPDAAADMFALGQILAWLMRGQPVSAGWQPSADRSDGSAESPLLRMIASLVHGDPTERPQADGVLNELTLSPTPVQSVQPDAGSVAMDRAATVLSEAGSDARVDVEVVNAPRSLGRFRILEMVGEGGLGKVFRGRDIADGADVAIKMLHSHLTGNTAILKRFQKEARLLNEIQNPYVANFIEVNHDRGVHYLALEFIDGESLSRMLRWPKMCPLGRWEEGPALALAIGVARALADAHRRGIIHRDIKPQNIMILKGSWLFQWLEDIGRGTPDPDRLAAMPNAIGSKLCDFGLARHVIESESLHLTRDGTLVGTPLYMSPEQALGAANLGPATDVYGLGATLYHVLAGQPPFDGDSALALTMKHAKETAPGLQTFNPQLSDGICRLVARCLAKKAEDRPADASELLDELERLARGEPAHMAVHPHLPTPTGKVLVYDWTWELKASPVQLWPYVSNTERLNRAAGVPAVDYRSETGPDDPDAGVRPPVRRFGQFTIAGITNAWRENPFEWVEGRRLGVLREYTKGVLKWFASIVELEARPDGGCTLTHRIHLEPRNLVGRFVAALEVGFKARRHLGQVYRRIDAYLTGQLDPATDLDPFETPAQLARGQQQQLERLLDRLGSLGVTPEAAAALSDYLQHAPAQEVARIRPLALARRLDLPADDLLAACLHGAREGLFVLLWDLVCPLCRISAGMIETLQALQDHGHCEACSADFKLDFANSVELIFRVHPQVRPVETRIYCVGGPAHSPHVAAQVRVAAGERFELDLTLGAGAYRLRGPQLPHARDFVVEAQAATTRWVLQLPQDLGRARGSAESTASEAVRLRTGRQRLIFENAHTEELVLRVERRADRDDSLTAARAASSALFRTLFPGEVLEAGRLVSVSAVVFLAADLGQISNLESPDNLYRHLDEARVFALLHEHCVLAEDCMRKHGGAVLKTLGETVLAIFDDAGAALRAARAWHEQLAKQLGPRWPAIAGRLRLRLGLHRGPALAATINGRLDYFGSTIDQALKLPSLGEADQLLVTRDLAADPHFNELLHAQGLAGQLAPTRLPGQAFGVLLTVPLPPLD